MDKTIRSRVINLEEQTKGTDRKGYYNATEKEFEAWKAGENIPEEAKRAKVYVGISPDDWD